MRLPLTQKSSACVRRANSGGSGYLLTQRNITHKREFSTHAALVSYEKFSKEMNRSWDWRFWRKRSRRHGSRFRIRNYWKTYFLCQKRWMKLYDPELYEDCRRQKDF